VLDLDVDVAATLHAVRAATFSMGAPLPAPCAQPGDVLESFRHVAVSDVAANLCQFARRLRQAATMARLPARVAKVAGTTVMVPLPHAYLAPEYQSALGRVATELADCLKDPIPGISVAPVNGDPLVWTALVAGPQSTPYEGAVFRLLVRIGREYPFHAPEEVRFVGAVPAHPNVSEGGHIHASVLGNEWSPALTIPRLLLSIVSLLSAPTMDGFAANPQLVELWRRDPREYERHVRTYTLATAVGDDL